MKEFVEKLLERLEDEKQRLRKLKNNTIALSDSEVIAIEEGAYDFCKKIINELSEEYKPQLNDNDLMIVESLPSLYPMKEFEEEALQRVIGCAKKEYNNGWIACSERLPEIGKWVLGQGVYDMMLVCYTKSYGSDFDWMDINGDCRVISAWQPLPAPYQKGSDV